MKLKFNVNNLTVEKANVTVLCLLMFVSLTGQQKEEED